MMRAFLHLRTLLSLVAVLAFAVALVTLATPPRPAFAETITVTTTDDENSSDGDCALREAVISANRNTSRDRCPAGSGNDTIVVPAGTYTFAIAPVPNSEPYDGAGDLDLLDAAGVTIQGAGPGSTIIDAAGLDRVFDNFSSTTITGLTITGGKEDSNNVGGGIRNDNNALTLDEVAVTGNTTGVGGGVHSSGGGTLTITDSTVGPDNSASDRGGGVFQSGGTANIVNSTVSGNKAGRGGGGVYVQGAFATMNIRNSTIANNTSAQPGNGIHTASVGAVANVKNTIISNNSITNCDTTTNDGTISSQANNIDNDNSCGLNQPTDKPNRDPLLGPLANNGGQTDTHALLSGSPAIDNGDSEQPADQRGVRRPQDGDNDGTAVDDMGAFERKTPPPAPTITSPPNNSYDTDGTIILSGSAEKGTIIRIYEGTTLKGQTIASSTTGAWSKGLTSVTDGRHTYTAKAINQEGGASPGSTPRTIIVDKVKPTVLSTVVPANGAVNVAPTTNVIATFSEQMKPTTINMSTVRLVRNGTATPVPAVVTYNATTKKVTLNPDANLVKRARYTVTITTGAKDLAGNPLAAPKVWSFTVKR